MSSDTHPINGALYEELGDGLVKITKDDSAGVFHWETGWVEGDILTPDLHFLQFIGGPQLASTLEEAAKEASEQITKSSDQIFKELGEINSSFFIKFHFNKKITIFC